MSIKNSWDPNSPTNRFSYYFYNLSPAPLTVPLTQLPLPPNVAASPHLTQLYKQAVLENPQPDKFIPALASSMDDLKKRVDAQRNMANLHLGKLKSQDIQGKISSANKKHYAETVVRIERLSREQIKLEEKLVHICARLAGLQIYAPTGTKDEAEMLLMLERIRDELGVGSKSRAPGRHPAAHGPRLAGIVNELWMVVSQRKALMMGARSGTPDGTAGPEWGVADESELRKVLEVGRGVGVTALLCLYLSTQEIAPHPVLTIVFCSFSEGPGTAAEITRLPQQDAPSSSHRHRHCASWLRSATDLQPVCRRRQGQARDYAVSVRQERERETVFVGVCLCALRSRLLYH